MGFETVVTGPNSTAMGTKIIVTGYNSFGIGLDYVARAITQPNPMAIMGGNVGIGTVSPQSALAVSGLPTAPPDGTTGRMLCVDGSGNLWIDEDGTYDCQ